MLDLRYRRSLRALVTTGALLLPAYAHADPASCPPGQFKNGRCVAPTPVATPTAIATATPAPPQTSTTTLLFPFVSNQAGFDTGISIANTSLDTLGTTPETGTCTLTYFGQTTGGNPAPPPQTSQPVPAGQQLTFVLSTGGNLGIAGRPVFQGYIMATCNFRYAHGYAFITDGPIGQASVADGYLALVVPEGSRSTDDEQLAH